MKIQNQNNNIFELQNLIDYTFKNLSLIDNALTHTSYINERQDKKILSNERLEFLGDSVLSLVVSEYLYICYPEMNEGNYTDIKASLVNSDILADTARSIYLGSYIKLSRGERGHGGKNNNSILADTLEALFGAIYLDSSYEVIQKIIVNIVIKNNINKIIKKQTYIPSKSKLQELLQNKYKILPKYKELRSYGPEHKKTFIIGVYIKEKLIASGEGKSKKDAEEKAASLSLQKLSKHI